MMNFRSKLLVTALLAAALAAVTLSAGCRSAQPLKGAEDLPARAAVTAAQPGEDEAGGISVTGRGTVSVTPDVAYVTLGVETADADAAKARNANDEAMAKVYAAVKGFGVAGDDITTEDYAIYPRYDDNGRKITGYTVRNTVSVRVKNLDKLGDVLTAAGEAGANTAGNIRFDVSDRTAAYNEALASAMEKARARAEVMAGACGVKLGAATAINESSSYSGPVYAQPEAAMDTKGVTVPVSEGQLEVTASVSVVYGIEK